MDLYAGVLDLNGFGVCLTTLTDASSKSDKVQDQDHVVNNSSGTAVGLTIVAAAGSKDSFDGTIEDGTAGGTVALSVSSGTLVLGGTNTYSGPTTIQANASLTNDAANALSPNSVVTVMPAGTLALQDNTIIGGLAGGDPSPASLTTRTLTVAGGNAGSSFWHTGGPQQDGQAGARR